MRSDLDHITDIDIFKPDGTKLMTAPVTDKATRTIELMKTNNIELSFAWETCVVIPSGSYIEYDNKRYKVIETYYPQRVTASEWTYQVKFCGLEDMFVKAIFFRFVTVTDEQTQTTYTWKEPEWSINGNLMTMATLVVDTINKSNFGETVALTSNADELAEYAATELKSFTFSGVNISAALSTIVKQFETEWWIERTQGANIMHFTKCEHGDYLELSDQYTQNEKKWESNGLESYTLASKRTNIPQRIYAFGSERNIVKGTQVDSVLGMNVSYAKRLHLNTNTYPDLCVEVAGIDSGIEEVKMFDDVYPRYTATIGQNCIRVDDTHKNEDGSPFPIWYIKVTVTNDVSLQDQAGYFAFDPYEHLIEGTTMMIRFVSGYLNGRDFEVKWHVSTQEFEIINDTDNGVQIPYGMFCPNEGDKFVPWNMNMPQSYVTAAENELAQKALEYADEVARTVPDVTCKSDRNYFYDNGVDIQLGTKVEITNFNYPYTRQNNFQSRVKKVTYSLTDIYSVSFTLVTSLQQGAIASLTNTVSEITDQTNGIYQKTIAISRNAWHNATELSEMLDSIKAEFALIGDRDNQFHTTCNMSYDNATRTLTVTAGTLWHDVYRSNENDGKWSIQTSVHTFSDVEDADTAFYVYARCPKSGASGTVQLYTEKQDVEDSSYYYFLLGVVSSLYNGVRAFNQTSGLTQIAGGHITTGVIKDAGNNLIIDFEQGKIIAQNGAVIQGNVRIARLEGSDEGGVLLADKICVVDEQGNIVGGLSGITDDNVLLFGGGTYNQAVAQAAGGAETCPILLTKDQQCKGSKFGLFKIVEDGILIDSGNPNMSVYVTDKSTTDIVNIGNQSQGDTEIINEYRRSMSSLTETYTNLVVAEKILTANDNFLAINASLWYAGSSLGEGDYGDIVYLYAKSESDLDSEGVFVNVVPTLRILDAQGNILTEQAIRERISFKAGGAYTYENYESLGVSSTAFNIKHCMDVRRGEVYKAQFVLVGTITMTRETYERNVEFALRNDTSTYGSYATNIWLTLTFNNLNGKSISAICHDGIEYISPDREKIFWFSATDEGGVKLTIKGLPRDEYNLRVGDVYIDNGGFLKIKT